MSPRRREGELGPALNLERLLDDLLTRAESGSLPLATEQERIAWYAAWTCEHPGHHVAVKPGVYDPIAVGGQRWVWGPAPEPANIPLAIRRRDAIATCEWITPQIARMLRRSKAEDLAKKAWEREHPEPPSSQPPRIHHRIADPPPVLTDEERAWRRARSEYMDSCQDAFDVVEEQAETEWAADRAALIAHYKLEDLVRSPVARLIARWDPPPPQPDADRDPPAPDGRGDEETTP